MQPRGCVQSLNVARGYVRHIWGACDRTLLNRNKFRCAVFSVGMLRFVVLVGLYDLREIYFRPVHLLDCVNVGA